MSLVPREPSPGTLGLRALPMDGQMARDAQFLGDQPAPSECSCFEKLKEENFLLPGVTKHCDK